MKAKALVVLVVAVVWGLGSWWWYACKIKGFCGAPVHTEQATHSADSPPTEAKQPNADTHTTEVAKLPAAPSEAQVADQPTPTDTQLTALNMNTPSMPELTKATEPTQAPQPALKSEPSSVESVAQTSVPPEPESKPTPVESSTPTVQVPQAPIPPEPPLPPTATVPAEPAIPATAAPESTDSTETASMIDPPLPTEPVTPLAEDSDKDGVPNELEKKLGLDPYMADSDKDGVSDQDELGSRPAEAPLDTDDDGIINALDSDDDGDGDPTANEAVDPNKDAVITDARDSDQDATPDYLDKDSSWATLDDDNDGLSNGEEKEAGTNPSLTDSDGDGVPDKLELVDKKDTDQDGILDALDTDDDNDGIMTAMENPDSNNDGKLDDAADHNNNGVPDYLDANSSGETVASNQNTNTNEPNPKDPDMATGQPVTASAMPEPEAEPESEPEPESEAKSSTSLLASSQLTAAQPQTSEPVPAAEKKPTPATPPKTDDTNKITVDLDKPAADKKNVSSARLYFPFRSTKPELADSTAAYFDDLISFLKANPKAKVKVIGHTDNVGDAEINEKLGLQRAERIRIQLIRRGAPADRVEASSKGESAPWVTNKTEEGRNKNRRVEVKPIK
ncbi:OmpA family protein [Thiothrix eikelboomii]|uniref:OmpA family protein n=1 Tax=Thiothrix eikelboomii TaxID=92487 RepID=A0A1T4WLN7_9GAMM|nr:OmpA family protein [Thiothrix eikelboomii]SKA78129.1 OmpA family protein [Thiothrix eikelboomii]